MIFYDVSCVYDNHYASLTRLSEVLQSRITSEPDIFEKMIQV